MESSGLVTVYCVSHVLDARLYTQQPPIEESFILFRTNLKKFVPDFLARLTDNVPEFACRFLIEAIEEVEFEYCAKLFTGENEDLRMSILLDLAPYDAWQKLDCGPDEYYLTED